METKHEKNYSQDNDEIVSNRTLRASEVNSRRGNSTKQARTICNKFKPGYNGATKVDSDPLNQNGEVTMSNNADTKLEMMQVQVDSNEKVINAGLAGHKAELAGYKSNVDGRFEAALNRIDADRKVADAKHEATMERMDADRKVADANHKVAMERMDADRKVADANHKVAMERMDVNQKVAFERMDAYQKSAFERMDADRKVADSKHDAAMERMDANQKAAFERMDANQKVADAKHDAAMERIDGNRRAFEAEFKAIRTENKVQFESVRTEMNENKASMKLWFIGTIATILAVAAGLITATITIIKAISDSQ